MEGADPQTRARMASARAAAELVEPDVAIGLGSGRAVFAVIDLLSERSTAASLKVAAASSRTEELAVRAGMEVVELDGELRLDLAIDGADEVDPQIGLIKGGGAALLREKLVIAAAERFVVVAEASKRVERLGATRSLPVEVVRYAWPDTRRRLLDLMPSAVIRMAGAEPVVTDEGHYLLDCELPPAGDLNTLASAIKGTLGVVEHGLFLGMAEQALLGRSDGEVEILSR